MPLCCSGEQTVSTELVATIYPGTTAVVVVLVAVETDGLQLLLVI